MNSIKIFFISFILIFSSYSYSYTFLGKKYDGQWPWDEVENPDAPIVCYNSHHHLWWQVPVYGGIGLLGGAALQTLVLNAASPPLLWATATGATIYGHWWYRWEVDCEDEEEDD